MEITRENASEIGKQADLYLQKGELDKAINSYEKLYESGFHQVNACKRLIDIQEIRLNKSQAKLWFKRLFKLSSDFDTLCRYLRSLLYENDVDAKILLQLCRKMYPNSLPETQSQESHTQSKKQKIRIAFLSANFHQHPIYFFIIGSLKKLNRELFEISIINASKEHDFASKEIFKYAHYVHSVQEYSHEKLNEFLREKNYNVLFELDGVVPETRLLALFKRVANIQVAWGGQFCSTGHPLIDYFYSDKVHTAPGSEETFSEKLFLSNIDYITYTAPEYAAEVNELPALDNSYICFASLNNPHKFSDEVIKLWANILSSVENSKILFRFAHFKFLESKEIIWSKFSSFGIEKERIILEEHTTHSEFLKTYHRVDIALDPFPYSGGLTTCEALWMGVPVISLNNGSRFSSMHSTSHLTHAGLRAFIASDTEEYKQKAIYWSQNIEKLRELRLNMRERLLQSPLMDHSSKAREIEDFCIMSLESYSKNFE